MAVSLNEFNRNDCSHILKTKTQKQLIESSYLSMKIVTYEIEKIHIYDDSVIVKIDVLKR